MNFSRALEQVKDGHAMTRTAWNNPATYIYQFDPSNEDKIHIRYSTGPDFLWNPSIQDIIAKDWAETTRAE